MSYQEKLVGNSAYFIFALAILLVYFALAGQYESWITPAAVILAVPMALAGHRGGAARPRPRQQHLRPDRPRAADRAFGQERHPDRRDGPGRARARAGAFRRRRSKPPRVRFRPILMTSFTFILGVLPLVLASGAGSAARRSLGIAVATGMLASTCLAVLFVPALFVVLQRCIERKRPLPAREMPSRAEAGALRAREVLHRASGPRERHRVRDDPARGGGALRAAGGPVSADHAADRPGVGQLSRGEREDSGRDGGAADRAAGQRRRGHAIHAVDVDERRPLHAHRDVRGRDGPGPGPGAGAEPRLGRARAAPGGRPAAGRRDEEEVDGDPPDRDADLGRQQVRRALSLELRDAAAPRQAGAPAGRGRRDRLRHRPVQHADLARPGADAPALAHAVGRDRGGAGAERLRRGGTDRGSADALGRGVPADDRSRQQSVARGGVRRRHREELGRPDHAGARTSAAWSSAPRPTASSSR